MRVPKVGAPLDVAPGCGSLNPLEFENQIVWLDAEARSLPYVRENLVYCGTRQGTPAGFSSKDALDRGERLVAFSTLAPEAPRFNECGFLRRVFTLRPQDTDAKRVRARTQAPCGAVDPKTLAPGRQGDCAKLTARDSPSNTPNS